MPLSRRARALTAGAAVAAAVLFGLQAMADADAADAGPDHGMRTTQELMHAANPGMVAMHERMMLNPRAREAHESMMRDADMAQMHQMMMGHTGTP